MQYQTTTSRTWESPSPLMGQLSTRVARVIDGYVGQVIADREIIWQSDPKRTGAKAERAAQRRIADRLKKLLG